MRPTRSPSGAKRRKTIALLLDYMSFTAGAFEAQVREAFHDQCTELGLNLLLVYGRPLDEEDAEHNAIFGFIRSEAIDGVVALSSCLGAQSGTASVLRLLRSFGSLPTCSVGVALPDVPSVVIDNQRGMEALIEHLIRVHGKRRIAFIGGTPCNEEAEARLRAYRTVLERHELAFDPALIATGYFVKWSGFEAMEEILARGVQLDAVVAANDAMAVGAIDALRRHGYLVPFDVPVTGFDDLVLARLGSPPLTTVAQHLHDIAFAALNMIIEQESGNAVKNVSVVPSRLVVRRSCGCGAPPRSSLGPRARPLTPGEYFAANEERIRDALAVVCSDGPWRRRKRDDHLKLLDAFRQELGGQQNAFLGVLDLLLEDAGRDIERHRVYQDAVVELRREMAEAATFELEELWFLALNHITVALAGTQVEHRLELDNSYSQLIRTGEQVSIALDVETLRETLNVTLPSIGIETAFLFRFKNAERTWLSPIACLVDGEPEERLNVDLPAENLFPKEGYRADRRHTSVVFPLTFEGQWHGVAIFEYRHGVTGYQIVRDDLSAALRSIALHQEVLRQTRMHERSMQEKQATAKRMQSLSVLAGGVAHDLNNALGPLVALPDIILRDLSQLGKDDELDGVREDVKSIQGAARRAVQTIKDLLTLGRQGRTPKVPLDLNRAVANAVLHGAALPVSSSAANLSVEAAELPLNVRGSEAHLVRAVSNLIRNAVEAGAGGEVVVRTWRQQLVEPLSGYEVVEPGDYAVVAVIDDGSGIPEEQLGQIFEPFFSTKRVGEQSGSGLGLAIVHSVVKEHNGYLDVTTGPSGTTFKLFFPLIQESSSTLNRVSTAPRGSARILLLDDDPAQRRTAERVLGHLGYQVDVVESGKRAYEIFARSASAGQTLYDLLIFDVVLNEELDGVELCERIRLLFPAQKALAVSGHAPGKSAERAIRNGMGWLPKPYTLESLGSAVAKVLGGELPSPDDGVNPPPVAPAVH